MNTILYQLLPQDAWFFRDGRPYNEKESNQADAESQFPPSPRTVSGAIRAALARARGWNGRDAWDKQLNAVLGNGPDDLGKLQFSGSFLLRNNQPLFPAPLHLLGKQEEKRDKDGKKEKAWMPATFLRPADQKTLTDIGEVHLPEIALAKDDQQREGLKPAEQHWLTIDGLQKVLAGALPEADAFIPQDALWKLERRVGLKRDASTLNTEEGELYSPAFVRLRQGIALGFALAGLPADWQIPSLFPLGGESRLARCEKLETVNPSSMSELAVAKEGKIHFTIIALTPVAAQKNADISALLGLDDVELISACVGKPVFFGGWNSLQREPLPLVPFHPAGSVWFCQAPATEKGKIIAWHGRWLGDRRLTAHGFGQIAIGLWPLNTAN